MKEDLDKESFAGHKLCGLPRFGRTRLAQVQKVEDYLPLTLLQ
jgi:hypothetical protein